MRVNRRRKLLALAGTGALVASLAACGGDDGGDGGSGGEGGGSGESWILGTTESITAMDPAGSYDIASWNMQYSIFEQLLVTPPSRASTTTRRRSPARSARG